MLSKSVVPRKLSEIVKMAGMPAAACGLVGDFFSNKGGWLITFSLGLIGLLVAVLLAIHQNRVRQNNGSSILLKIIDEPEEYEWYFGARIRPFSHAFILALVFASVSFVIASKSYAQAGSGGFVATNFDAVAGLQRQLGLSEQIISNQKQTNQILTEINQRTDGLKRETSQEPRKELANLGVVWNRDSLRSAMRDEDTKIVSLFLDAQMRLTARDLELLIAKDSERLSGAFLDRDLNFDTSQCMSLLEGITARQVSEMSKANKKVLIRTCAGQSALKGEISARLEQELVNDKKYRDDYSKELAKRRTTEQCLSDELSKKGMERLLYEVSTFSITRAGTLSGRQVLLADIYPLLATGAPAQRIEAAVRKYCIEQASQLPNLESDNAAQVQKWRELSRLMA